MESTSNYINQIELAGAIESIPALKIRKMKDKDVEMLFKIMYWSALRPGEGIRLKKEDFVLPNRIINLGQTKTKKNDKAVIPRAFIPELEQYLKDKPDGKLFNCKYITFYKWLKRLGKINGIEAWTTHTSETGEKTVGHIFRKSVGKDMMFGEILDMEGNKIDIPVISQHMRHSKPSMTIDHYLKATSEQVKNTF